MPGASGYLVHRAETPDGPFGILDHLSGDVLAVPGPPYADTTGVPSETYRYTVSSLAFIEAGSGELSTPIEAASRGVGSPHVRVEVDASAAAGTLDRLWRPMIGSEHLSLLAYGRGPGDRLIGQEVEEALRLARSELGVRAVRAHAILHDELRVYREVDGRPVYDFARIDEIYDRVMELGLRPIVELSFMPHDLAADPSKTVFQYRAIVSPPKDWARWGELVGELARHLVERYGIDEVSRNWAFEVWNEANLEVFWSGTREEYIRLYDVAARAIKAVDSRLRVGGPASAAAGWIPPLLEHVAREGVPIDFLSSHTYGSPPLDLHATAERYGLAHLPAWWTEWGVSPRHNGDVNDLSFGAPFICRSMKALQGRAEAIAYWVISDHFEELGWPGRLFHGGFGLLTVGNLRKPRFWALALLERLDDELVACQLSGDGAGSVVDGLASRAADGRIKVLLWNGTLDQGKTLGEPLLSRRVDLAVSGLGSGSLELSHWRVDEAHSNIRHVWERLAGGDWPDEAGWKALKAADKLDELEPTRVVDAVDGSIELSFELPMPAVSMLELRPG
ncbi:MAG: xylan 1,4-beta-xylosidase [Chloroflexi bacterium]|nr:xylan 1,4-beta-xylosidase [Chloroflexota bacterium]